MVQWQNRTEVKIWKSKHTYETRPRLGQRLHRRGLSGQPKQTIKTNLGQVDPDYINREETLQLALQTETEHHAG